MIIELHQHDADISTIVGKTKGHFTQSLPNTLKNESKTPSGKDKRESNVWQRRFFDHRIRDEADYALHFDYLHYNPVKHGYVDCPSQWPFSSFARAVDQNIYPPDWCCPEGGKVEPQFDVIANTVGE